MHTSSSAVLIAFIWAVVSAAMFSENAQMQLPEDVASFKKRRDLCDHFRGEDPYDGERRIFLEENIRSYCKGTDKELASLIAKYGHNRTVLDVLEKYERKIEDN